MPLDLFPTHTTSPCHASTCRGLRCQLPRQERRRSLVTCCVSLSCPGAKAAYPFRSVWHASARAMQSGAVYRCLVLLWQVERERHALSQLIPACVTTRGVAALADDPASFRLAFLNPLQCWVTLVRRESDFVSGQRGEGLLVALHCCPVRAVADVLPDAGWLVLLHWWFVLHDRPQVVEDRGLGYRFSYTFCAFFGPWLTPFADLNTHM